MQGRLDSIMVPNIVDFHRYVDAKVFKTRAHVIVLAQEIPKSTAWREDGHKLFTPWLRK